MPRISITLSDDAHDEIIQLSEETGKPIALILREAVKLYLQTLGKDVDASVAWGGKRKRETEYVEQKGR